MLPIAFIVLLAWFGIALLVLPVMLRVGRAARRADDDALRQHAELATYPVEVFREPLHALAV